MKFIPSAVLLLGLIGSSIALAEEPGRIEVVGPAAIDFGKYQAIEKKVAKYRIRNSGKGLLKIIQVRKTCGCASATCDKQELKPMEEATIEVVILPNSIFGLYSKNTFVESTDPANRFLQLTTAGNAIPLVEVKPSDLVYVGRIPTNAGLSQSFALTPTRAGVVLGQPFLTNTSIAAQLFMERLAPSMEKSDSGYRLDVKAPPCSVSGDLNVRVLIPVENPSNHPPVEVGIVGKTGIELSAAPGMAYLSVSEHLVTRTFAMRLLGNRTRILDPKSVVCSKQEGVSIEARQDADGRSLLVTVTFSPEFTKQLYADEIIPLTLSVPGASSARVVCKARK